MGTGYFEAKKYRQAAAICLLLLLCLASSACREKPWDPEIAVLVNSQAIPKRAVDKVLELGFNPTVTENETKEAPDLNLGQILDKLIHEQLILQQASRAGLSVSDEEVTRALDHYSGAWFGASPPPAELGEMKEALHRQLLLRKMTERVMRENLSLSASGWHDFWGNWPKKHPVRYRVRLLVIPPTEKEPRIPARYRRDMGDMVEYLAKEGLDVLVEGPIWTNDTKITPDEVKAIEEAFEKKQTTKAFQQTESWIIFEPLEIDRGPDEVQELLLAKTAFEELEGEKVFQAWLAKVRRESDIQINPAYVELSEASEAEAAQSE